jgi:hypothetical protein
MSGDSIEAQESQGYVNNPQRDVEQHYGNRNKITSGGGHVAQGNMDNSTKIDNLTKNVNNFNNIFLGSSVSPHSPNNLVEELRKILDKSSILDSAQNSAYQAALALQLDADVQRKKSDKLSDLYDRKLLPDFVNFLARNSTISEPTRIELKKFISEHGLQTNSSPQRSTIKKILKSYLVIVIKELQPKPKLKFKVDACLIPDDSVKGEEGFRPLIINEDINEGLKNNLWSPSKITDLVKDLLKQSIAKLAEMKYELTIEFFLPMDYLYTEVDQLKVIPAPSDENKFYPISNEYRVLVRSQERLGERYKNYYPRWEKNWERLDTYLKKVPSLNSFEPFNTDDNRECDALAYDLEEKIGIKIGCILSVKKRKILFNAILLSALPIAVWLRKDVGENDLDGKFNDLITSCNLEELPECIRKERRKAYRDNNPAKNYGYHLALLWEDPYRIPFHIDKSY